MPEEIISVQCASCHKLHPKTGAYLIINELSIQEKKDEDEVKTSFEYKRRPAQLCAWKDTVVCGNDCLANLISFKGF